jgi:hypothetical protein
MSAAEWVDRIRRDRREEDLRLAVGMLHELVAELISALYSDDEDEPLSKRDCQDWVDELEEVVALVEGET